MGFRVEHPPLLGPLDEPYSSFALALFVVGEYQEEVLEHLREPKALLAVQFLAAVCGADVSYCGEAALRARGSVDGDEGVPRPVLVHAVSGRDEGVVVALDDFWPQVVVGRGDPEAVVLEELLLVLGDAGAVPGPPLGADVRGRGGVRVVAGRGQGEAVVGVVLGREDGAGEEEVAADEAGKVPHAQGEGGCRREFGKEDYGRVGCRVR